MLALRLGNQPNTEIDILQIVLNESIEAPVVELPDSADGTPDIKITNDDEGLVEKKETVIPIPVIVDEEDEALLGKIRKYTESKLLSTCITYERVQTAPKTRFQPILDHLNSLEKQYSLILFGIAGAKYVMNSHKNEFETTQNTVGSAILKNLTQAMYGTEDSHINHQSTVQSIRSMFGRRSENEEINMYTVPRTSNDNTNMNLNAPPSPNLNAPLSSTGSNMSVAVPPPRDISNASEVELVMGETGAYVWRHRVGVSLIAVRHGSGSGSNSGK
jgi:hypothetical protein